MPALAGDQCRNGRPRCKRPEGEAPSPLAPCPSPTAPHRRRGHFPEANAGGWRCGPTGGASDGRSRPTRSDEGVASGRRSRHHGVSPQGHLREEARGDPRDIPSEGRRIRVPRWPRRRRRMARVDLGPLPPGWGPPHAVLVLQSAPHRRGGEIERQSELDATMRPAKERHRQARAVVVRRHLPSHAGAHRRSPRARPRRDHFRYAVAYTSWGGAIGVYARPWAAPAIAYALMSALCVMHVAMDAQEEACPLDGGRAFRWIVWHGRRPHAHGFYAYALPTPLRDSERGLRCRMGLLRRRAR